MRILCWIVNAFDVVLGWFDVDDDFWFAIGDDEQEDDAGKKKKRQK